MSIPSTEVAQGIIYHNEKNRLRLKVVITRRYEKPNFQIPTYRKERQEAPGIPYPAAVVPD